MRQVFKTRWTLALAMFCVSGVAIAAEPAVKIEAVPFSPGVVNARPCFPGAYYRKAVSDTAHWRGITGVIVLPKFLLDPTRRDPATGKALDNPSVYMGGSADGQEIDAGVSYEIVKEPDGRASTQRKAFRPFWRNQSWSSAPADPRYYYYAGDTLRMTVETTSPGTLGMEIVCLERGEEGRAELSRYADASTTEPNDFLSTLTVQFDAKKFGPSVKQEFKRVNAIDQVGREAKSHMKSATRVEGAVWKECWLLREGERLPFSSRRYDDMRCPSVKNIVVKPGGDPGRGGEDITILGDNAVGMKGLEIPGPDALTPFTMNREERFLVEPREASMTRGENETVWVSDIEHLMWEATGERFLADDPTSPVVLARDTISAGNSFELFPYHYLGKDEATTLGAVPKYHLVASNETTQPLTVTISGMGKTNSWGHEHAWRPALVGEGATSFTLAAGDTRTLWHEKNLRAGYPWSAVVLGHTTGDLTVTDYCYLGDKDPGSDAPLMPDMAWAPHILASFSRGLIDWFTADVAILPEARGEKGQLPLSAFAAGEATSLAFGYSPGGPINNLCDYRAVQPTFVNDVMRVLDPLSGWDHVFFGGNYPAIYRFELPLVNDSRATRTLSFHLASNDRFGVHSTAGVWVDGRFLRAVTPALKEESRWHVWSLTLAAGESRTVKMTIVPLGGLWGGFVGTYTRSGV